MLAISLPSSMPLRADVLDAGRALAQEDRAERAAAPLHGEHRDAADAAAMARSSAIDAVSGWWATSSISTGDSVRMVSATSGYSAITSVNRCSGSASLAAITNA